MALALGGDVSDIIVTSLAMLYTIDELPENETVKQGEAKAIWDDKGVSCNARAYLL